MTYCVIFHTNNRKPTVAHPGLSFGEAKSFTQIFRGKGCGYPPAPRGSRVRSTRLTRLNLPADTGLDLRE